MEEEEDIVQPVDVAEQLLPESRIEQIEEAPLQFDTVSTAVSSPEILQPDEPQDGGEEFVIAEVTDDRESGVENVEQSKLKVGEDENFASRAQLTPVVHGGDDCAVGDAVKVAKRLGSEIVDQNVQESKLEREDDTVFNVDKPGLTEEVFDEVAEEGSVMMIVERGNEGEDAEELREEVGMVDEAQFSPVVEVRDDLASEGVTEECVERENEGQSVKNVEAMDDRELKEEDDGLISDEMEVKDEEVVERNEGRIWGREALGSAVALGEDDVLKIEEMTPRSEEMVEMDEEMVEMDEKVTEKDEEATVGEKEAPMSVKEVGENDVLDNKEAALWSGEIHVADEKGKAVNADESAVGNVENSKQVNVEVQMVLNTDGLLVDKVEKANDEEVKLVNDEVDVENVNESIKEVKQEDGESNVEEKVLGEVSKGEEDKEGEEMVSSTVVTKDEDDLMADGDETPLVDTQMEMDNRGGSGSGGKSKRGRRAKAAATTPVKTPSGKLVGEAVCFICLDGGDLVLCDRRGCHKAYHPSCIDQDEEFFKTKGRWNCGWHLCNKCRKNAYFMCFTCQFSLCKGCSKDATFFCVRGNKGFCETCMKTIMIIESSDQNEMGQDAFSDKSSWESFFKDYWIEQKEKLCITSDELGRAKNPWKDSDKQQPSHEVHEGNTFADYDTDVSDSRRKKAKRKAKFADYDTDSSLEKDLGSGKKKPKRKPKSKTKEANSDSEHSSEDTSSRRGKRARKLSKSRSKGATGVDDDSAEGNIEWASNELLEFVMHMKNGDSSVLTQFDVQSLLLEYIKRNQLRDPRRQSQIICDSMLKRLFGKPRVGHFEMLKLLESHFFLKDDRADMKQGTVNFDTSQLDADDNTDLFFDGGRSKGKKSRKRGEDREMQSNLDDYAAIDAHNINLIFLRRNIMEALMDNSETFHDKVIGAFVRIRISGSSQKQDIYRLVQITGTRQAAEPYKVGKRMTEVMLEILNLDKTEIISLDIISNQEFTEDECKRLRQSIKCGLINRMTVGDILEKAREFNEVRVTDWIEAELVRLSHLRDRASEKGRKKELRECVEKLQLLTTPEERQRRLAELPEVHADPKMDPSWESEDESEMGTTKPGDARSRESGFSRRGRNHFSPRKGDSTSSDSWSANARPPNKRWEPNRNLSGNGFSSRREDPVFASPTREHSWQNGVDKGTPRPASWERPRMTSQTSLQAEYSAVRPDMSTASVPETSHASPVVGQTDPKVSDTEKMWHYRDPNGKVQGPFSMVQLRKWSNTGYFPPGLSIWRAADTEGDSILLTNALAGRFHKDLPSVGLDSDVVSKLKNVLPSIDTSKYPGNARSSAGGGRYDSSSFPSPTPTRSQSSSQFRAGNERLPSPTPTSPSSDASMGRSNFSNQTKGAMGNRGEYFQSSVGTIQHGCSQQVFASPGARSDLSSSLSPTNGQQSASQSTIHSINQQFTPPSTMLNQANLASNSGQGLPNAIQTVTGQTPSLYGHGPQGWSSGYVARAESVTASLTTNNPNAVPAQVAYGQWAAPTNQTPAYGAGYATPGHIGPTVSGMISQNAWRPAPTNTAWAGQQQQVVNQNMARGGQQTGAAFGQSPIVGAMGQHTGSVPGALQMPGGTATMGWSGSGPNPSAGTTNPGWVAPQGNNASGWGGDQRHNESGVQYTRQSSFGSGGPGRQRVSKFH